MLKSLLTTAFAIGLLSSSACAGDTSDGSGTESRNDALMPTNHPGPNYIIEQQTFDAGKPKVLDGFASRGAPALLEDWDTTAFPPGQQWVISASGELKNASNSALCLDVTGNHFAAGVPVETWSCNGQDNQKWSIEADRAGGPQFGAISPIGHSSLCLDVKGGSTANGAVLELWPCNGQSNQHWAIFSAG